MKVHVIDVGWGNMVLIQIPNGKTILCDCNIKNDNEEKILDYLSKNISKIDVFINTHRDADHMRGIKKIHEKFGITEIWDSGVPGTTLDTPEYREYMNLRREIGKEVSYSLKCYEYVTGKFKLLIMNSKNKMFNDPNEQSLVIKIEYGNAGIMLPGDTSYKVWQDFILPNYSDGLLKTDFLLASHHGSKSFFDHPEYDYTTHIEKMSPAMTLISVGDNPNGHPDKKAIELYEKHSRGSYEGNKVYRTDKKGTMLLTVKEEGGWNLITEKE